MSFRSLRTVGVCIAVLSGILFSPLFLNAQIEGRGATTLPPITVAVPITGSSAAYGDIIDFDTSHTAYVLSQFPNDPYMYGVAIENPPAVLSATSTDVPIARTGTVLVNVTLENGPIKAGDRIVASSISGKGMRASDSNTHALGVARESFDGATSGSSVRLPNGNTVAAGTIEVELDERLGSADSSQSRAGDTALADPTDLSVCAPILKCMPLGTFMRYITAALVSFGSVYLAFRSFMKDALNGVTSIGRNPRAKTAIQGMVIFNATLAAGLALAGLAAGLVILLIKL